MNNKEKNIPWDLIIAKLKQDITESDDLKLSEWLHQDINREVFEELRLVWGKVQQNASVYTPDTTYYWKELSRRMEKAKEKPATPQRFFPKYLRRYAAVACVALAVALSATFYVGVNIGTPKLAEQTYANLGGKSKIQLPDDTEVWLHSNSKLSYKNSFQTDDRIVVLSGEAFFDVTPDKSKRFVVETGGMKIIVHGTKFNVESTVGSDNTLVSLIEGSVALETPMESSFLQPGQMAIYNKKSRKLLIEKADVNYSSSWASDKMIFTNQSLGHICRFLSKWYSVKINLDPALENKYRYTFTLRNEPLEEILRLMSRINPTAYEFNEENELTIFAKP